MPLRTRTSAADKGENPTPTASAARSATRATAARTAAEPAKKAPAKTVAKAAPVAKSAPTPTKSAAKVEDKTPAKAPAKTAVAKKAAPAAKQPAKAAPVTKAATTHKAPPKKFTGGYSADDKFLTHQRELLVAERATYVEQARSLKAEAESLVEEMEPGDIQFDEESGEGGTVTVDRERDLALSAQALLAVEEIDAALGKISSGRYGICEGCGELIGKPRLEALPYARLCIACKSGGLSRR